MLVWGVTIKDRVLVWQEAEKIVCWYWEVDKKDHVLVWGVVQEDRVLVGRVVG